MSAQHPPERLAERTTLRLGGPAAAWVRAENEQTLVATVLEADAAGQPVLVLGGGSNLVVGDAGFAGVVVEVATRGICLHNAPGEDFSGVRVTAEAGEDWDGLVASTVDRGLVGLEALSGIPGSVGATPVQNVGAYGQEVADTLAHVRVLDRAAGQTRTFAAGDCGFGYRTSRFKREAGRYVVLSATFRLPYDDLGAPVRYAELAGALGVEVGDLVPPGRVRAAVLQLRGAKGMVLDPADPDTWSAGSFFTNPVVPADRVPEGAPRWEQPDGRVKTSAAWLIEQAGFAKGYAGAGGRVSVSTKHTLALTNRGTASAAELLELAETIRAEVERRFGIRLENEPVLVGCDP